MTFYHKYIIVAKHYYRRMNGNKFEIFSSILSEYLNFKRHNFYTKSLLAKSLEGLNFRMVRPAGIEPAHMASKADTTLIYSNM